MKRILSIIISVMLYGCTVVYKLPEPVPPTPQAQVLSFPQPVATPVAPTPALAPAPTQAPKVEKILTVSETIQLCQKIKQDKVVPIGCEIRYVQNSSAMYVSFQNANVASTYWTSVVVNVTGPFCTATNSINRQGVVILIYSENKMARIFNCETNLWGDWFNFEDKKGNQNYS